MRHTIKISDEELSGLYNVYCQGYSLKQLQDLSGYPQGILQYHFHKHGFRLRARGKRRYIPPAECDRLIAEYKQRGAEVLWEAAQTYHMDKDAVRAALKRHDATFKPCAYYLPGKLNYFAASEAYILWQDGINADDLAAAYDVTPETLYRSFVRHNLTCEAHPQQRRGHNKRRRMT